MSNAPAFILSRPDGVALDRVSGLFSGMRRPDADDAERAKIALGHLGEGFRIAYHSGCAVPEQVVKATSERLFGKAASA